MENGNQPAFPISLDNKTLNELKKIDGMDEVNLEGMSKREYFAGLFAAQMCAGVAARMVADRDERYNETNWKEVVAANAVEFADALLTHLSNTPK